MTRSVKTKAALFAASLLLSACGSTTVSVPGSPDHATVQKNADGTMDITTDQGHMTTGGGMPTDWPSDVTLYPGAQITTSANVNPTDGKPGMMVMFQTSDAVQKVADFYTTSLKSKGWKIDGSMNMGTQGMVIAASKGTNKLAVSLAGSAGQTTVTLGMETGAN